MTESGCGNYVIFNTVLNRNALFASGQFFPIFECLVLMHVLESLLQNQLASDQAAVQHLPTILTSVSASDLLPSSHTHKWTTRIHSLINSKVYGAKWAGLSIARKTANLNRDLLVECAQGWIANALPLLSVNITLQFY